MTKEVRNCINKVVTVVILKNNILDGISPVTNHHTSKQQSITDETTIPIIVKIVKNANSLVVMWFINSKFYFYVFSI